MVPAMIPRTSTRSISTNRSLEEKISAMHSPSLDGFESGDLGSNEQYLVQVVGSLKITKMVDILYGLGTWGLSF